MNGPDYNDFFFSSNILQNSSRTLKSLGLKTSLCVSCSSKIVLLETIPYPPACVYGRARVL